METVSWVTAQEDLHSLSSEWAALFSRCENPSPFLHPRWVKTWWGHFGDRAALKLLCLRRDGVLVGIAPLMQQWERWRVFPVRALLGPRNGQSPRPGLLLARDVAHILPAVLRALDARASSWDAWRLDGLDERESRALREAAAASSRLKVIDQEEWFHSYLPLEGDWPSYLAGKTAKFRKSLRYTDNLLGRQGRLQWIMHATPAELEEAVQQFLDLDSRSWKREEGEWLLNDPKLGRYYCELVREFGAIGACRLFMLSVDGKPIAGVLCLLVNQVVYTLKTSFDDGYARFSPGTSLFHHLIQSAYELGYQAIDFVGKIPFSEQWTDETRAFHRMLIMNSNCYSRMLAEIRTLRKPQAGENRELLGQGQVQRPAIEASALDCRHDVGA